LVIGVLQCLLNAAFFPEILPKTNALHERARTSRYLVHARQTDWLTALKVHSHQSNPLASCNQPANTKGFKPSIKPTPQLLSAGLGCYTDKQQ